MDLNATREEKMKVVYDCLIDGLPFFGAYGLEMDYNDNEYDAAKAALQAVNGPDVCREDIWVEIVKSGGSLVFSDIENDGEEVGKLNLDSIDKNWPKLLSQLPKIVGRYLAEDYDAGDTDCIIQVLIFGEVVYG